MILKQLFDTESSTYTYLISPGQGSEAVIIDPVHSKTEEYLSWINSMDLKLAYALDTHTHADHVTALGDLRDATDCITIMGEYSQAGCVSQFVKDGEVIKFEGMELKCLYTPGHTNESFCFYLQKGGPHAVFTGDTLLINGTGRTDFQNGDAEQSYRSIVDKLFSLDDGTLVYPGHDYNGNKISTIGKEKQENPRLAGKSQSEYIEIMNNLNLPDPKLMDLAIPANLACGNMSGTNQQRKAMDIKQIDDDYFVSAQITVDDVEAIKAAGMKSIICNRPDNEAEDQPNHNEIQAKATELGLHFAYLPINKRGVNDEDIEPFKQSFNDTAKPILAYCRTGNRSTSLWSLAKGAELGLNKILEKTAAAGYDMTPLSDRIQQER